VTAVEWRGFLLRSFVHHASEVEKLQMVVLAGLVVDLEPSKFQRTKSVEVVEEAAKFLKF